MPGRNRRDGGFLHRRQALERNHDPPHRAEQAHVRTDRADIGQEFEVAFQAIELARGGRAHAALRAFQLHACVDAAALADAVELAHAAFEDRLEPFDVAAALGRVGVQLGQLGTGPEALLEIVSFLLCAIQHALLAQDDHPDATEANSSNSITSCTGRLACRISCSMFSRGGDTPSPWPCARARCAPGSPAGSGRARSRLPACRAPRSAPRPAIPRRPDRRRTHR
jgi:hypothetical protein